MSAVITLYRSNRVEVLAEALCVLLSEPAGDPLQPEYVLVHSTGMASWLQQVIANRLDICAQVRFPFPLKLLPELVATTLGRAPESLAEWRAERLTWHLLAALDVHLPSTAFDVVRRYLERDATGLKRIQLAERIAGCFDRYQSYRPGLLTGWERGRSEDWQAVLWRHLSHVLPSQPLYRLIAPFFGALDDAAGCEALPPRMALFGISTLPPLHLELLSRLGDVIDLHFFLLAPTYHYFADIRSKREIARAAQLELDFDRQDLALDEGHPLLASLGRVGREFQDLLTEHLHAVQGPEHELFVEPASSEGTLLAGLQGDILHLVHRVAGGEHPPRAVDPLDRSVEVHACHGPMRQVEVLQDRLLALLNDDSTLEPRDVLVMTPDLATFAPFIEAVFDREPADARYIPWSIADRPLRRDSPVANALLRVLDLVGTRLTAPQVMDMLLLEPIRERFGIPSAALDELTDWVRESGIRWAVDAQDRARFGQPDYRENTWRFGLDRLLLGFALPDDGRTLFEGVLPFGEVEGGLAQLLGAFVDFCESLFETVRSLERPRSIGDWRRDLLAALDRLVAHTTAGEWQHQQIRAYLDELSERGLAAGADEPLSAAVIRQLLGRQFDEGVSPHGFMAGGVTFCAMLPMRSIPFRVVVLLGMDERAFPRHGERIGFDLMRRSPLPGDRSRRHDDRYLFLEALLSARDRMVVTFTGQSIRDNSPLPPSVVVSELLDTLSETFTFPGPADLTNARRARDFLVARHPLQPFSPENFRGAPERRSFAASWLAGARSLVGALSDSKPFFGRALPPPGERAAEEDAIEPIELDALLRFFADPLGDLLKRRLGIRLWEGDLTLETREPIELGGLEQWKVGSLLLNPTLEEAEPEEALAVVRGAGRLPLGRSAECAYSHVSQRVVAMTEALAAARGGEPARAVEVEIALEGAALSGRMGDLYGDRLVRHRLARPKGKYVLDLWLRTLVLAAAGVPLSEAAFYCRKHSGEGLQVYRFRPPAEARTHLEGLVGMYRNGQSLPLLLFPNTSLDYAVRYLSTSGREATRRAKAVSAASKQWGEQHTGTGEGQGFHVRRVLDEREPFLADFRLGPLPASSDLSFHAVALQVFGPLLAHVHIKEVLQ